MSPKLRVSPREAVERTDALLRQAVRLRLRSDVPVGCFLSGGVDSGIVTAMAAEASPKKLTTITVGFEDAAFDERPLARMVAKRYDTDHRELVLRPDVVADLPRIAAAYDQPFGDASAIPSYYVARAARQHVKVVLNGDGGDELFAGYRRYVAAWISGRLWWADGKPARPIWRSLASALPMPRTFRSAYAFTHRMLRGMGLSPASRYLAWSTDGLDQRGFDALLGAQPRAVRTRWHDRLKRSRRIAESALHEVRALGSVDRMLAADFATLLPHDLLVKMDIATMAHGLEARSPLLDHELIDTVSRFPEEIKLRGFQTKPLLRALARRYVPDPIPRAPKRGFEVPLLRWLRADLRSLCEDVMLARDGLLAEMFDRAALERLLREKDDLDPARWSRRVWLLLMLGMWDRCVRKPQAGTAAAAGTAIP